MAKGVWRRVGDVAVPVGATSREFLSAFKDGGEFIAETHGARNPKQLNMWWALCELVAENDDVYDTREKASEGLKRALHHVDTFLDRDGRLHITTRSIAVESLKQEEWFPLFKAAIEKVAEWLGSAPADIQARFDEITADRRYDGYLR